jgi:hypothetical protein
MVGKKDAWPTVMGGMSRTARTLAHPHNRNIINSQFQWLILFILSIALRCVWDLALTRECGHNRKVTCSSFIHDSKHIRKDLFISLRLDDVCEMARSMKNVIANGLPITEGKSEVWIHPLIAGD